MDVVHPSVQRAGYGGGLVPPSWGSDVGPCPMASTRAPDGLSFVLCLVNGFRLTRGGVTRHERYPFG